MDRFSDNDLIQGCFERAISSLAESNQPIFLLDEDFTVKWANDAAHREFPAYAKPDGIRGILRGYPDETARLENENEKIEIPLAPDSQQFLCVYGHTFSSSFRIYMGIIDELPAFHDMNVEEMEQYLTRQYLNMRTALMNKLLQMRRISDEFAGDCKIIEQCHSFVWKTLQGYRQYRMLYIDILLTWGICKHTWKRIDLVAFLKSVYQFTEGLITIFAKTELLYSVPESPIIVEVEAEHILFVLAQLISNAIKYQVEGTPVKAEMRIGKTSAEICVANQIPDDCPETIENQIGLDTASKLAAFIGGSLTYKMERHSVAFFFQFPFHLDEKQPDKSLSLLDAAEMRAQLCIDLCDAMPTYYELMLMI